MEPPADWGVDAVEILPAFDEVAVAFETRQTETLEQNTFAQMREEYPRHFTALAQHPRTLVGTEVPSATGDGMETLRDSQDAADWQDAMKQLIVDEVASRVSQQQDEMRDVISTVHASIDLFRNNSDLIPGTKQFDRELADAFAKTAKDYELRAGGKLVGYSVPVQPMINALRSQIAGRRAVAAPTAQQTKAAAQERTPQGQFSGPQAGLRSQAGQSSTGEGDDAAGVMGAFFRQNGIVI